MLDWNKEQGEVQAEQVERWPTLQDDCDYSSEHREKETVFIPTKNSLYKGVFSCSASSPPLRTRVISKQPHSW